MAMTNCGNGHYYDSRKHISCPFCQVDLSGAQFKNVRFNQGHNSGANSESPTVEIRIPDDEGVTIAKGSIDDDCRTVSFFGSEDSTATAEPRLAGWLVCIDGVERGRDYRIARGVNRIGRAAQMEIYLTDPFISKSHARIIYDPVGNGFFIVPDESCEVECNKKMVYAATQIHDGDVIRLGNSRFVFVAFCKEGRSWNHEI